MGTHKLQQSKIVSIEIKLNQTLQKNFTLSKFAYFTKNRRLWSICIFEKNKQANPLFED